jgi:hypothetical protein
MTDEPTCPPNDRTAARERRLRDALRENLRRRKSQSRGRLDQATTAQADGDPNSVPSWKPAPRDQDEST